MLPLTMKTPSAFILAILANKVLSSNIQQQPLFSVPSIPPTFSPPLDSLSLDSLLELHQTLVEYSSITGTESSVEKYLVSYLSFLGLTVETQIVTPATTSKPARSNILAYLGSTRKTRTLLSSHIDTVPPYWPYERKGNEIWGRGTVDAKASVATQIHAFLSLLSKSEISEGDVSLLFVVGEETGGDGMKKANDLGLSWDTVIFGEPTELKLASGHKGILAFQIRAKGKAGHSGYPELARNANAMLIPALYAILQMELGGSEEFGNTTLNIGKVEGGVAANVIAEDASALMSIRVANGTISELKSQFEKAVRGSTWGEELEIEWSGNGYEPIPIDHDVEGLYLFFVVDFI